MKYSVKYHKDVVDKDIPKLSSLWKRRIQRSIKEKLGDSPELYSDTLRNDLAGYRKLRVWKYRVVFRVDEKEALIYILAICHREDVYEEAGKRT